VLRAGSRGGRERRVRSVQQQRHDAAPAGGEEQGRGAAEDRDHATARSADGRGVTTVECGRRRHLEAELGRATAADACRRRPVASAVFRGFLSTVLCGTKTVIQLTRATLSTLVAVIECDSVYVYVHICRATVR